ncbi:MAG: hypothetical protein GY795_36595 [Desulfobacterales bacterium]|nr:hypothetical protein [Desulfobacterales bacterium]
MSTNNDAFALYDDDAKDLFQQLKGIDYSDRAMSSLDFPDKYTSSFQDEDNRLDNQRILLINTIHLLTSYFQVSDESKMKNESFDEFAESLEELARMSEGDRSILIRYRGFPASTDIAPKTDYVASFGNITVDTDIIVAMFNRIGKSMSRYSGILGSAFKTFSSYGINNLYMEIPELELNKIAPNDLERIRFSLHILSRYNHAFKTDSPIGFGRNGSRISLPLVYDEKGHPDPNLTLLSGLNGMNQERMRDIVSKVDSWVNRSAWISPGDQHISVYNAIFRIKNFKDKLIRPPIEMNNLKWTVTDKDNKIVSREKAGVVRFVMNKFGDTPRSASRIMHSVYGNDYKKIDSERFGERIRLTSDLLNAVGDSPDEEQALKEVLRNIRARVEQVGDETFDNISVKKNVIKVRVNDKETTIRGVPAKLLNIIKFYKGRSGVNKKMKDLFRYAIDFDAQDYNILARDLDIPVQDVIELIGLLRSCFDKNGHFLRKVFENNIPEFARYERKVFDFIWHYLKMTPNRNDRVAFLNSLQLLILRMKQRRKAIQVLLADLIKNPYVIDFPDRNAFMLGNLLVRKFNKEINIDIELTPEEVLLVGDGLDKGTANAASNMVDSEQENFIEKIKTVHRNLMDALYPSPDDETEPMPVRYLLSLEREAYIFFSLVGGNTAHYVLRTAMKKYGNPKSEIYMADESGKYLIPLLQHLKVVVRAMGRIARKSDLLLFEEIISKGKEFARLGKTPQIEEKIRRVMNWVDICEQKIIGS